MKAFSNSIYSEWAAQIEVTSSSKLKENVLRRFPDKKIAVNFDSALSSCIQEVKYLNIIKVDSTLPVSATEVFNNKDEFRTYIGQLELMVRQYNTMTQTMLEVEKPLVIDKLQKIDSLLDKGAAKLPWKGSDIPKFISEAGDMVKDLYNRLNFLKGNVKTIEKMIASWMKLNKVITSEKIQSDEVSKPTNLMHMIAFWRNKNQNPEDTTVSLTHRVFQQWKSKTSVTVSKASDIIEQGNAIHKIVETSKKKIQATLNSVEWKTYITYLNELVAKGIQDAVKNSLQYLIDSFSPIKKLNRVCSIVPNYSRL